MTIKHMNITWGGGGWGGRTEMKLLMFYRSFCYGNTDIFVKEKMFKNNYNSLFRFFKSFLFVMTKALEKTE